jgi:hypothetical protein
VRWRRSKKKKRGGAVWERARICSRVSRPVVGQPAKSTRPHRPDPADDPSLFCPPPQTARSPAKKGLERREQKLPIRSPPNARARAHAPAPLFTPPFLTCPWLAPGVCTSASRWAMWRTPASVGAQPGCVGGWGGSIFVLSLEPETCGDGALKEGRRQRCVAHTGGHVSEEAPWLSLLRAPDRRRGTPSSPPRALSGGGRESVLRV